MKSTLTIYRRARRWGGELFLDPFPGAVLRAKSVTEAVDEVFIEIADGQATCAGNGVCDERRAGT
jgi:hypothetical protein